MKPHRLDWLYPRHCAACGAELDTGEHILCTECLQDLPLTRFWNWRGNPAEKKLWGRCRFETVSSLFYYHRESICSDLTPKIKYGGDRKLGLYLGKMHGRYLSGAVPDIDIVAPVPIHPLKKWKRGYNQAEVAAIGTAAGLGNVPVCGNLLRRRHLTRSQTRTDVGNKWENVGGDFAPGGDWTEKFSGRHILLVDDVLTTGATAEACWSVLKEIPDVRLSFATLAYVE